jgi:hypothetical protein
VLKEYLLVMRYIKVYEFYTTPNCNYSSLYYSPPQIFFFTAAGSPSVTPRLSELLYDWRFTASQFVLVTCPLRLTTSNFFQLNTCFHSPYVTCSLQFLLALASAVTLRSDSRGIRDHILLSQILNILKHSSYLRENTLIS